MELATENDSIRYSALVDSGAEFCIFDAEIGEALGIDVKKGHREKFGGIQRTENPAEAFFHPVKLRVGGSSYYATVAFSYDIGRKSYGVLGQIGFLIFL